MFTSKHFHIFALSLVAAVMMVLPKPSYSQGSFDSVIETSGKLKAVRGPMMTIVRDDETEVLVKLHDDPTKLLFSANAKPQGVRIGTMARIEATFGPAGVPDAPIAKVELFQINSAAKLPSHARERYLPGIYPMESGHDRGAMKPNQFQPGRYRVVGAIAAMGPEGIILNAGQTRVPLPIAPDASWLIRYHDLSLALPGDPVKVSGFHQPPDETKIMASDIRVTVDRVYGENCVGNRPARRSRGSATERMASPKNEAAKTKSPGSVDESNP